MVSSTTLINTGLRPSMRAKAGAMAHRHSVASRNVAMVTVLILLAFILFMFMVQVSNQVNGLRARIASLQDQQEYLEANGAALLAKWNKATTNSEITLRAQQELGLQLPVGPAFVLVRDGVGNSRSAWHNIFQGLTQGTANAAEVPGNSIDPPVEMMSSP